MSKKSATSVSSDSRWQAKHVSAMRQNQEDQKDVDYNKRQQIFARITQIKLKPKMVFKAKLEDDLRAFEYEVKKIDRQSSEVYLEKMAASQMTVRGMISLNQKKTVRKLSVFDKLFGPNPQTRNR